MKERQTILKPLLSALAGILIGFALTANYGVDFNSGIEGMNGAQMFLERLTRLTPSPAAASGLAVLGGCLFMRVAWRKKPSAIYGALALLFGVVQVCVNSMNQMDSLDFWLGGGFQAVIGSLCMLGWALLIYPCFFLLEDWLLRPEEKDKPCWLDDRTFLKCFGCMAGVYLIWAVVFYPGNVDWDTYASLNSSFHLIHPSNAHLMLFNWLLGGCVWLGRALGSDNLGLFIFVLLQLCICAAVYAAVATALRRAGLKRLSCGALCYFALTPLFGMFTLLGNKDTLFSCAFCVFALLSWKALDKPQSLRFWAKYAGAMAAVCLFRHGAMVVAIPIALATVLINQRGVWLLRALGLLAAGVMVVLGFNDVLLPALNIEPVNSYEAFSLPYQQTARTVRDAGETLTQREIDALNGILDVERMGLVYTPWSADNVKGIAHEKVLPEREKRAKLGDFLSVWKDLCFKHPRIYIEAFLAQGGGYLALPAGEDVSDMCFSGGVNQAAGFNTGYFNLYSPPALEGARQVMTGLAEGFRRIPLLGLMHQCGFYTWVLAGLIGYMLRWRGWRALPIFAAPVGIIMICLISPMNAYFRYFLPVATTLPVVLAAAKQMAGMEHAERKP